MPIGREATSLVPSPHFHSCPASVIPPPLHIPCLSRTSAPLPPLSVSPHLLIPIRVPPFTAHDTPTLRLLLPPRLQRCQFYRNYPTFYASGVDSGYGFSGRLFVSAVVVHALGYGVARSSFVSLLEFHQLFEVFSGYAPYFGKKRNFHLGIELPMAYIYPKPDMIENRVGVQDSIALVK